ncbi:unnamed protein product [Calypogeia fissa]
MRVHQQRPKKGTIRCPRRRAPGAVQPGPDDQATKCGGPPRAPDQSGGPPCRGSRWALGISGANKRGPQRSNARRARGSQRPMGAERKRSPDRGHSQMWWDSSAKPRENVNGSINWHVVETHTVRGGDGGGVQHEGMRTPGASKSKGDQRWLIPEVGVGSGAAGAP